MVWGGGGDEVAVGLCWMGWCGDGEEASAIIYPAPGWHEPDVRCDKTQTQSSSPTLVKSWLKLVYRHMNKTNDL